MLLQDSQECMVQSANQLQLQNPLQHHQSNMRYSTPFFGIWVFACNLWLCPKCTPFPACTVTCKWQTFSDNFTLGLCVQHGTVSFWGRVWLGAAIEAVWGSLSELCPANVIPTSESGEPFAFGSQPAIAFWCLGSDGNTG